MTRLFKFCFFILPVLLLASCTSTPIDDKAYIPLPQLTFEHLVTIPVNVAKMDVSTRTKGRANAWDIANKLATPPDVAMQRYLHQRYKPVGANGVLNVNLTKADVIVKSVPNENSFLSYIPFVNDDEYSFEITVELENLYNSGLPDRTSSTRFVRKVRVPPQATLAYREAILQRTMEEIIRDIDEALAIALVDEYKIVNRKNLPVKAMPVKTVIPELTHPQTNRN
jgi:hypothetical protein